MIVSDAGAIHEIFSLAARPLPIVTEEITILTVP